MYTVSFTTRISLSISFRFQRLLFIPPNVFKTLLLGTDVPRYYSHRRQVRRVCRLLAYMSVFTHTHTRAHTGTYVHIYDGTTYDRTSFLLYQSYGYVGKTENINNVINYLI